MAQFMPQELPAWLRFGDIFPGVKDDILAKREGTSICRAGHLVGFTPQMHSHSGKRLLEALLSGCTQPIWERLTVVRGQECRKAGRRGSGAVAGRTTVNRLSAALRRQGLRLALQPSAGGSISYAVVESLEKVEGRFLEDSLLPRRCLGHADIGVLVDGLVCNSSLLRSHRYQSCKPINGAG
jgi:hypothetical protein